MRTRAVLPYIQIHKLYIHHGQLHTDNAVISECLEVFRLRDETWTGGAWLGAMGLKVLGVLFFQQVQLAARVCEEPADFDPQVPRSSESLRILDTRPLQKPPCSC